MHHLNLKQRQIDHYHQISSLSPLIHTPIQDHATSCTDNRTTFSSQRVYICPSPINNSGITNPQPTTAYIFITRYQGRAKLDGCASAVSCSSVGGARAASPRHSAFCCERHTVSKWSYRLKYVTWIYTRDYWELVRIVSEDVGVRWLLLVIPPPPKIGNLEVTTEEVR